MGYYKTNRKKNNDLTKRASLKDEAKKRLEDKARKKENSIQDLCVSFITILGLFLYNLSNNNIACEVRIFSTFL